jgi:CubicO group peptidase (beta-lactamase class C family)
MNELQLHDLMQRYVSKYLESARSVGLGMAVVAGESAHLSGGGRLSGNDSAPPADNTLFEIGSITKVFTAMLLAEMHLAGAVGLNDRVNQHLPPQGRLACRGGDDVTLLHLATHSSGLPRLPANLSWSRLGSDNPYADYSADELYAALACCRLKYRPGTRTLYSNLGSGLLGHILSQVGGASYEQLVTERILQPLGMHDTVIRLSDEQRMRLAPGHAEGEPVSNWDFQVLAGAGAFRSTTRDMVRFLRANIDPGATPLPEVFELVQRLQTRFQWKWYRDFGCLGPVTFLSLAGLMRWQTFGLPLWARVTIPFAVPASLLTLWQFEIIGGLDDMALGWHFDRLGHDDAEPDEWALWHNGGTGGYASYLAFSRRHRIGVVLLANSDHEPDPVGRALLMELFENTMRVD